MGLLAQQTIPIKLERNTVYVFYFLIKRKKITTLSTGLIFTHKVLDLPVLTAS